MADSGAVLKFPGGKPNKKESEKASERTHGAAPLPVVDSYDYEQTVDLYQVAISVKRKAEELVKFVDENWAVGRQAGIELLSVQCTAILEGDRFDRVIDALEDAVYRRVPVTLSRDGVDKVHRLEKLIAEADTAVVGFMNGRKAIPSLGQSSQQSFPVYPYPMPLGDSSGSDLSRWTPIIIFGIAGIVGIIAILALTQKSGKA